MSGQDSVALGKAARKAAPRSALGAWQVLDAGDRDPVTIVQAQDVTRLPELVPVRYARMLVSPFTFYRGAAAVMAADLARGPSTGLTAQLAGDAHLANFGGFSAPDRAIVFDVNDFDETLPGPVEWDIKRLVASFAVAGRHRGFTPRQRESLVLGLVEAYRVAMREFAAMSRLDVWYARLDAAAIERTWGAAAGADVLAGFRRQVARAQKRTSARFFSRYTTVGPDGVLRPVSDPPFVVPLEDLLSPDVAARLHDEIRTILDSYDDSLNEDRRRLVQGYRFVGAARKVVGVGSVGTRCYIGLLVAEDDDQDDLVLQFKEASASVLEAHLGPSAHPHHGQRVVEGQRLMQAASDILLGWDSITGVDGVTRHFYVRQMWDGKVSADLETLSLKAYGIYARMCAWTLARAHARSGDRKAIASYFGTSDTADRALAAYAESYADQNDADFALLKRAAAAGRIVVSDVAEPAPKKPTD